jgi:hypothetical protein
MTCRPRPRRQLGPGGDGANWHYKRKPADNPIRRSRRRAAGPGVGKLGDGKGTHRSFPSVPTTPSRWMTFIPFETRPKIVCLPSRKGVGASVMKN